MFIDEKDSEEGRDDLGVRSASGAIDLWRRSGLFRIAY